MTLELEFNWPKLLKKSQFFFVDQKKTRELKKKEKQQTQKHARARETHIVIRDETLSVSRHDCFFNALRGHAHATKSRRTKNERRCFERRRKRRRRREEDEEEKDEE